MRKKYIQQYSFVVGIFLIIVGVLIAGVFFIKRRTYDMTNSVEMSIAHQRVQKERIEQLPLFRKQLDKIQQHENIFNVLVHEDEVVVLIKTIEEISDSTGVAVEIESKDIQQDSTVNDQSEIIKEMIPKEYKIVVFNVTAKGTYQEIVSFLYAIERMQKIVYILGMDMRHELKEIGQSSRSSNLFSAPQVSKTQQEISDQGSDKKNQSGEKLMLNANFLMVFPLET